MGKLAIVFSGQGAQYSGMGKSLYENIEAVKKIYDNAEYIFPKIKDISFNRSIEELSKTINTQPCMFLVDLCSAVALKEYGISADGVAGFSLGEIVALAYADVYSYDEGFEIVMQRACLMQKAAEKYDTSMAAVLKMDSITIEKICDEIPDIYPANYNSPAQTVVAGSKAAIEVFKEKVAQYKARVIDLAVNAAFHSPYMNEAANEFEGYISKIAFNKPSVPVYSNYTSVPYGDDVLGTLSKQMNNPVRWCKTIENMISDGYTDFIEAGAGKTLTGLIKKISDSVNVYSVDSLETLKSTVEAVKNND